MVLPVTIDPSVLELAEKHLNENQLRTWKLVHVHGMSLRAGASYDRTHRTTFVDRYDAACLNLERAGVKINASGLPYLEETA
jgi:hypothetical protein